MAKSTNIENAGKDLNNNLERDFNILLRTIIVKSRNYEI